jgi:hypothetical protein
MKSRCFFVLFCLFYTQLSLAKEMKSTSSKYDSEIELAKILDKSDEFSSSYTVYSRIIEQKENDKCFDSKYIEALYGVLPIACAYDSQNVSTVFAKLQKHDPENCPKAEFKGDRLIMENLPECMCGRENGSWIKEVFIVFGMNVSDNDIEYGKNSVSVKMPSCGLCPCCK